MNREQPPVNDIELLSAYIDGELTDAERIELNSRLENEPALQAELDSLQATVDILQSLPMLKAPHDFRLDPAVYGRKTGRIINLTSWRLISAVGVAAAVLLIVGSLALLDLSSDNKASLSTTNSDVAFEPNGQNEDLNREQTQESLQSLATTLEFEGDTTGDPDSSVSSGEETESEEDFVEDQADVDGQTMEEAAEEAPGVMTEPGILSDEPPSPASTAPISPTFMQQAPPEAMANGMGGGIAGTIEPQPEDVLEAPDAFDEAGPAVGGTGRSADSEEERDDDDRQPEEAQTTIADGEFAGEDNYLNLEALVKNAIEALISQLDMLLSGLAGW